VGKPEKNRQNDRHNLENSIKMDVEGVGRESGELLWKPKCTNGSHKIRRISLSIERFHFLRIG
jgi:hypothetical protein